MGKEFRNLWRGRGCGGGATAQHHKCMTRPNLMRWCGHAKVRHKWIDVGLRYLWLLKLLDKVLIPIAYPCIFSKKPPPRTGPPPPLPTLQRPGMPKPPMSMGDSRTIWKHLNLVFKLLTFLMLILTVHPNLLINMNMNIIIELYTTSYKPHSFHFLFFRFVSSASQPL